MKSVIQEHELELSADSGAVSAAKVKGASEDSMNHSDITAQPNSSNPDDGQRGRSSAVKLSSTSDVPLRQFIRDSRATARVKSCTATDADATEQHTTSANLTAIFSKAGPSCCCRPTSHRHTPTGNMASGRNTVMTKPAGPSAVSRKSVAASRPRSPWRSGIAHRSNTEICCGPPSRERHSSVSGATRRSRPADHIRSMSTSRVRRTVSAVSPLSTAFSICRHCNHNAKQTKATTELSSRGRGRTVGETQPAVRPPSRLPRPIHPVRRAATTVVDELATSAATRALKSAWNKIYKMRVPVASRARFLVVFAMLLSIVGAIIVGHIFVYVITASLPPTSQDFRPSQPVQPSHEEPDPPASRFDIFWMWCRQ